MCNSPSGSDSDSAIVSGSDSGSDVKFEAAVY